MQLPARICKRYHVVFYTFLCPTSYIMEVMAGTGAANLDHEVTLAVEVLQSRVTDRRKLGAYRLCGMKRPCYPGQPTA